MRTNELLLGVIIILVIGLIAVVWGTVKRDVNAPLVASDAPTKMMQLQAYERLTLLVERIALPNLITRISVAGMTAREMQLLLTQNIRQEFDYNISQQVYVSTDAWNAVKNLKEQNLLAINQIANTLPANATGLDLNKQLVDFSMNDKKGALHEIVSNVVSNEAKKIL